MDFVSKALTNFKTTYDALSNVHIHRARCRRLGDRLQILERYIQSSFRRKSPAQIKYEQVFKSLANVLSDIARACEVFGKATWIGRCAKEGDEHEFFTATNKKLSEIMAALQIGIDPQTVFVAAVDEQDLKKDQQLVEDLIASISVQVQQNKFEDGLNPDILYQQLTDAGAGSKNVFAAKLKALTTETEEAFKLNRNRRADIQRLLHVAPNSSALLVATANHQIPFSELVMLEKLGDGIFSSTFHGKYKRDHVCIKKIRTTGLPSTSINDFIHQLEPWFRCRQKNVALLSGYCVGSSHISLVIEFLTRKSLRDNLVQGGIPWATRIVWLKQASMGLAFLHQQIPPVVHQNLTTSNILITEEGEAKVTDFCLASLKKELAAKTRLQVSALNAVFTAPELLDESSTLRPMESSDIYSFGFVMWETAALKIPFSDMEISDVISYATKGRRPPLPHDVEIPDAYSALIDECWHHNPLLRPLVDRVSQRLEGISQSINGDHSKQVTPSESEIDNPRLGNRNGASSRNGGRNQSIISSRDSDMSSYSPSRDNPLASEGNGVVGNGTKMTTNASAGRRASKNQTSETRADALSAASRRMTPEPDSKISPLRGVPELVAGASLSASSSNASVSSSSATDGNASSDLLPKIRRAARMQQDSLDLTAHNIDSIPNQITTLTNLTRLILRENRITALPIFLTALSSLRHLDLRANPLTTLPTLLLGLSHLDELLVDRHLVPEPVVTRDSAASRGGRRDLSNSTASPSSSSSSSSSSIKSTTVGILQYLSFIKSQEGDSSSEIAEALSTDAIDLDLTRRDLSHLPPNLGLVTGLTRLQLQQNRLCELSGNLFSLPRLAVLNLSNNRISSLPSEVSCLVELRSLLVAHNALSALPDAITHLTALRKLVADGNPLQEPPLAFAEETPVVMFYMSLPPHTRLFVRGVQHMAIGDVPRGATLFAAALELDPALIPALLGLRSALARMPHALKIAMSSSTSTPTSTSTTPSTKTTTTTTTSTITLHCKEEHRPATLVQRAREALPETLIAGKELLTHLTGVDSDPGRMREYMNLLGMFHTFLDPQHGESAKWLQSAADQGHPDAQFHLALAQSQNHAHAHNHAQIQSPALELLRKAAEHGHADAQFHLAVRCEHGDGCPQNYSEASRWYRAASDQGHSAAQYALAFLHEKGIGVHRDDVVARDLYSLAAAQGHIASEIALGRLCLKGVPPPPSSSSSNTASSDDTSTFQKQGTTQAKTSTAAKLKDYALDAVRYFRRAAEHGHPTAFFYLGLCHEQGLGVAKDDKEAVSYYTWAYEQGSANATLHINNLGRHAG
eukprot:TRINITY_DN2804_c0_g2_i3.p2 TRINITY_DN2804_c0_g2~~TRINITY_DN2804_c0_g2_i3.p2  ORF type:complete len:1317 (+),score=282.72 TRINITY_DN2804_c0_g2_i3:29-3979(+)